ncbi:MAG: PKD domain-containing protein [Methanobacteriota archaeon]
MKKMIVLGRGIMSILMVLVLVASVIPGISMGSSDSSRDRPDGIWNLEYVGSCPNSINYDPNIMEENHTNKVIIQDNYAYITSYAVISACPPIHGVLDVMDISNPEQPVIRGSCHGTTEFPIGVPHDIIFFKEQGLKYVYVANTFQHCSGDTDYDILEIVVTTPSNPSLNPTTVQYSSFNSIALSSQENTLYAFRDQMVIPPTSKLHILDLPFAYYLPPDFLVQFLGPIYDMQVQNNLLYIIGNVYHNGPALIIIDITDPSAPEVLSITSCLYSRSLAITVPSCHGDGKYAYLGTDTGLQIFDVTDPDQPICKGTYLMPAPSVFVCTNGQYAYVSSGTSGITVLDISYPAHPLPTGYYTVDVNTNALSVKGDLIFAADDINGLLILRFTGDELPSPRRPSGLVADITGSMQGIVRVEYNFFTMFPKTQSSGDEVSILWSWGDNTFSEWLGPFHPGEMVRASHAWTTPGTYLIRVKAQDAGGLESPWSLPLIITIR